MVVKVVGGRDEMVEVVEVKENEMVDGEMVEVVANLISEEEEDDEMVDGEMVIDEMVDEEGEMKGETALQVEIYLSYFIIIFYLIIFFR